MARMWGAKDTKLEDFVLRFDTDEEVVGANAAMLEHKAAVLAALFGGEIIPGGKRASPI